MGLDRVEVYVTGLSDATADDEHIGVEYIDEATQAYCGIIADFVNDFKCPRVTLTGSVENHARGELSLLVKFFKDEALLFCITVEMFLHRSENPPQSWNFSARSTGPTKSSFEFPLWAKRIHPTAC